MKTRTNNVINPDEKAINNILYSLKFGTTILSNDCKEFRRYNVQYNNIAFMAL